MAAQKKNIPQDIIAVRDKLYRLMLACLEKPARVRVFRRLSSSPIKERAARYETALSEWFKRRPPADPWDKSLALAEILFNHGLYFDTHEYLESIWNASSDDKKICAQGLIQIAAGFHKIELNPGAARGAEELISKGMDKLAKTPAVLGEDITAGILAKLKPVLEQKSLDLPPRLRLSRISP